MQREGFLDEVRGLVDRPLSRTASEAIGYREMLAHVSGEIPEMAAAVDAIVRRTRRFARRQRAWFRRDPRVTWVAGTDPVAELVRTVTARWDEPVPLSSATR